MSGFYTARPEDSSLTVAAPADDAVQDGYEVGDDTVDLVESSQNCDHI